MPHRHANPDRVLLERWHCAGDQAARAELLERYLGFARALARRFAKGDEALDDLEQVAAIGLLRAIDRYDLERDVALTTFAMPGILGELRRHFRDRVYPIRVPRPMRELERRASVAMDRLGGELGRAPTLHEVSDDLDEPLEAVRDALGSRASRFPKSLGASADGDLVLEEIVGVDDGGFISAEDRAYIEPALSQLDDRDSEIVRLRFEEELSQSQIADRMSMSQMHVSRLLRRALGEMHETLSAA